MAPRGGRGGRAGFRGGSRGGSRGGPRGGSRGGRGGRGRGGGMTRGKRTFSGKPKFDSERLAEIEDEDDEMSQDEVMAEDESDLEGEDEEDDDDSEEEQESASVPAYMALMQSFSKDAGPQAKRRKTETSLKESQPSTSQEEQVAEDENEQDEDQDLDLVEEPEEGPEDAIEVDDEDDEDENPDATDPFESHFANPDSEGLQKRLKAIQSKSLSQTQSQVNGWRAFQTVPGTTEAAKPLTTLSGPSELKLKRKLRETISEKRPTFDRLEQLLYPLTFGYNDLFFCSRTAKNAENLRRMACLHAINHVFKTRDRVIKNNAKLSKEGESTTFEPRDQGFTRPKVLMLLPTRQSAVKVVNTICSICQPDQQENRKRFDESYIDKDAKFASDRPEDFRELFEGNDDDMFRLGVKFTRKTIKYFSQFYNSDILLASPLGLRMAIGSEEDKAKNLEYDFLSSIEIVIMDQADALLMQNWDHVEFIFEHLNLQPKEAHGCDFSRVREWYLDKQAQHFRQNIFFSAFNTPELAELYRQCQNWAGKVRVQPEYPGTIQELGIKAKQTFSRFEATSIAAEPDARFAYFTSAIVPNLVKRARDQSGTLIFIPSYLDFVRVRNYFATSSVVETLTFGNISEYSDVPEASRARSHFLNGRHKILLYTERAHHFRRYVFKGVQRVILYGLPDNPIFYKEICGDYLAKSEQDLKIEPGQGTVRVMFSKYDLLKLERIVGSKRVGKMIRERGDTFDFV